MKTGAFWAIAGALFLIASRYYPVGYLHYVALGYSGLAILKAGWES